MSATGPGTRAGSILFTDLVGFTEYTDARGDHAAIDVLDRQLHLVAAALEGFTDCRVVKELGDGLMLWFARSGDALAVASEILRSIVTARRSAGFPLNLRMGLHCGEVVERGTDFIGQTVNIASRVCDIAGPGELVVSEQVIRAVPDERVAERFGAIGPVRVKGVSDPIWLYRLVS